MAPQEQKGMPSLATSFDKSGLVAIVTGGARGLGRAMALGMLRDGFRVVIAHLPKSAGVQALNILVASEGWESWLIAVECDVTKWEQCQQTVENTPIIFAVFTNFVTMLVLECRYRQRPGR